jgi:hypothetical protein
MYTLSLTQPSPGTVYDPTYTKVLSPHAAPNHLRPDRNDFVAWAVRNRTVDITQKKKAVLFWASQQ